MGATTGRKPTDLDYGLGEHSFDADRLDLLDEAELTELLVENLSKPTYRPPRLPAVATELLEISREADVGFKQIEALLEQDSLLAGEVLARARSALYAGVRPINSLGAALVRIGLIELRGIVLRAALELRVFRSAVYVAWMDRLRTHSLATANLSRLLSRYTPVPQDRAFLCGLLHDVGIAGILLVLGEDAGGVHGKRPPDLTGLWPAIHGAHARAGARMVELWRLQPEIYEVVAAHHTIVVDGADNMMAAHVCLADSFAADCRLGLIPSDEDCAGQPELAGTAALFHGRIDRSDPAVLDRARKILGLTDEALESFRADARAWLEAQTESCPTSR